MFNYMLLFLMSTSTNYVDIVNSPTKEIVYEKMYTSCSFGSYGITKYIFFDTNLIQIPKDCEGCVLDVSPQIKTYCEEETLDFISGKNNWLDSL